jgi:tetratricopeptide (TPR) repeat protein
MRAAMLHEKPDDEILRRDLAISYEALGLELARQKRWSDVLEQYQRALEIQRSLMNNRENPQSLRDLPILLERISGADRALGRIDDAGSAARESFNIRQRRAQLDASDVHAQRDLADGHALVARFALQSGSIDDGASSAVGHYRSALAIMQRVAHDHPDEPQIDQSVNRMKLCLAASLLAAGKSDEAVKTFSTGADSSITPDVALQRIQRKLAGLRSTGESSSAPASQSADQ